MDLHIAVKMGVDNYTWSRFHTRAIPYPHTKSWRSIVREVASVHGMGIEDLLSRQRTRPVVRARWEAMVALRSTGRSYPQIGALFGLDHTTVMYGCKEHARLSGWRVVA